MKIQHLMEGIEPKMPGAPRGIQIMTPQQFVAKAGDMPSDFDPNDIRNQVYTSDIRTRRGPKFSEKLKVKEQDVEEGSFKQTPGQKQYGVLHSQLQSMANSGQINTPAGKQKAEQMIDTIQRLVDTDPSCAGSTVPSKNIWLSEQGMAEGDPGYNKHSFIGKIRRGREADNKGWGQLGQLFAADNEKDAEKALRKGNRYYNMTRGNNKTAGGFPKTSIEEAEQLDRIRQLSGLDEATKLPAQSREFGGDEFQDYMNRIVGTPDIDKKTGLPKRAKDKISKKTGEVIPGAEKYVSGKTKTDKYKLPYIHRSSVIEYLGPDGKTYDEELVKKTLKQRPKALLKQNEKMKHSNGELEQFFNVGFAALTGIAVDEQTNNLIIVNTCPGAGSCKVDCFAMKGGKVQFKNAWQSDGRILTYLLNDPDGFVNQLSNEISKEEKLGQKGNKKFPNGWQVTVRWHDAGDFFSPEYLDLALKMAAKHPNTKFYAYTKMAGAALAKKPDNFIINWSEGAHTSQEKQVKQQDPSLDTTKNSRIVPDELFQDLLIKDQKGNLVKGGEGQWQVQPDKLPELKQRLAKQYGLSANSILSYAEYMAKRNKIPAGMKYNVIVAPGEGDISANDPNIISTLLLRH